MVATDTLVGIIGAVALVAVMVGVFVYEYNNEQEGGDGGVPTDQQNRTLFQEAFPGFNATQDLDDDGIPNYRDADLDGDGTNNTQDQDVAVTFPFLGSIGPTDASVTVAFPVGDGVFHIVVTVTTSQGQGLPHEATLLLANPEGEVAGEDSGSGTLSAETDDVSAGEWDATVQRQAAAAGPALGAPFDFTGTIQVHYHYEAPADE